MLQTFIPKPLGLTTLALALVTVASVAVPDDASIRTIKVQRGAAQPLELVLSKSSTSSTRLGRSDGSDIRFSDRTVSRRHAELNCKNGACVVVDVGTRGAGSLNGTFVNGTRLQANKPTPVKRGDIITLGPDAELSLQ